MANSLRADERAPLQPANRVVVILIDTLRADHLPFYGYKKNTAPFLSSLAKESLVFSRAYAGCSSTAPSVASVFTSLYPSQHGVITGHIATKHLQKNHGQITLNAIPAELSTIAEEFKSKGYKTFGVADNLNISKEMGFTQGFDKFETFHYKGGETLNQKVKEWEKEIKASEKYYLYLHYMDAHKPYKEQKPWFVKGKTRDESTLNAYDSNINFLDERISELFKLFGWEKDTLIILLADHGEEFGDHGGDGHGKTLYTEVIHVPFMFYRGGFRGAVEQHDVHTIDLLPTLASAFGFPQNPKWQGKNVFDPNLNHDRPLFSELLRRPEHARAAMRSVVRNSLHAIDVKPKKGKGKQEIFDLKSDFAEKNNLRDSKQAELSKMVAEIASISTPLVDTSKSQVEIEVDEEALEQLRTLGYAE